MIPLTIGSAVIVVSAAALCLRWLLRPGEDSPNHIKRRVLRDRVTPGNPR